MHVPEERLQRMLDTLRQNNCRITPQRLAVLKVLSVSQGHPSVEEMHRRILKEFPTTSLATVYKIVNLLKEHGQVLELRFNNMGSRYDGNRPSPHPHVICTACGKIVDPEFPPLTDLSERMADLTGYRISSHRLDFYGLCPDCRNNGK